MTRGVLKTAAYAGFEIVLAHPPRTLAAMSGIFRRLALGLVLIVAAAALLLLSDLNSRIKPSVGPAQPAAPNRTVRIALLQHASQLVLDEGRVGMLAGLAEHGWRVGDNVELKYFNAEGDIAVAQTIAQAMASGGYDLLLTISTVSFQAVANANRAGATPHVFGLVTDPYGAGVGISRENHLDHPPHLAGYGTMQPVALAFKTAREMNPTLKTVGVIYNAAEANSVAQIALARQVATELGISLVEATVDNSAGVGEATNAVVSRGVDAVWIGGDVTVMTAVDAVVAAAKRGRVPVFTVIPPNVKRGTLFDLGADYIEVGRLTGLLAGEILHGRSPATVAVENVMPETLTLNYQALAGLKDRWTIPDAFRARAALVIDETGASHAKAPAHPAAPPSAAAPRPAYPRPGHTYRIAFASFAPEPSLDACQAGLLEGLRELGWSEGQNLVVHRTHAQGEMVNIPQMIQNLDSTDADALVTFSTPVLQSALGTAKRKPVVFTYVTDPLAAGAGKTYDDHAAHVTGIGSLPPIDDTVKIIRRVLPQVKRLGTLYNSGEANSVKIISLLRESAQRADLDLVELTAANSNEVLQAMQALVARGIDAFYLPSDNTAYLAFDAIRKVTQDAKLPLIVDDPDYVSRGALFACGPGYFHSGKAAAPLLARVLLGESPAKIPMANVSVNTTRFNPESIARLGLNIAPELIREIETAGSTAAAPVGAAAPPPRPTAVASTTPANPNPTGKKWKIAYVLYNETPPAEETLAGMKRRWAHSPLVEGRDYEIKIRSAQGDMASLSGIIDAVLTDGADIIVPLSTPTLQLAVQKVKRTPIVFTLVANPMAAGAGKSYTNHLPNVSGISVIAPFREALDILERHFPTYKRLGTLFCPAEANSVDLKESLEAECKRRGLILEAVAANTPTDLPDAALSLVSKPIDAIFQISDNMSSAGFAAIARAARSAQKPLLSLNSTGVKLGAAFGFGRDYEDAGEATVAMLERVIRGEDIAKMPFELPPKVVKVFSVEHAKAVGMTLPPALLEEVSAPVK